MNWQVKEVQGYTYFMERGYRISVPIVDISGYDFIAERDGSFLRVNVKVAGLKNPKDKNSWAISKSRTSSNTAECDVFLVYLPHKETFIELPGNYFQNSNSKCKRILNEI